jgi:hypothetical protein
MAHFSHRRCISSLSCLPLDRMNVRIYSSEFRWVKLEQ